MKLRTFEGEQFEGEMTTDFPISQDGIPVLLVNDRPFSPEKAATISLHGREEVKGMRKLMKLILMIIEIRGNVTKIWESRRS
jgi:hypothetical protein